ncbi:fasciclin domain-containing protein [Hydrogenophaga sp. 5NK40-0174]|uniref:fasciclin domain-containing protein n=1 Tax=Hydrogenophaga sp. 5NK40-0174 TaxID=3127649 RepID=UPI00310C600A
MKMDRRNLLAALAAGLAVPMLSACGGSDDDTHEPANTVVDVAAGDPQFSILVEAVQAAGLVETLSGPGPFTVFAPTNDAFAALLGELGTTKEALLADTDLLTAVLTYHVLSAKVVAADVQALPKPATVDTVQGSSFTVNADLSITDGRGRTAMLVATDVMASNGVIHVIDKVILPPA